MVKKIILKLNKFTNNKNFIELKLSRIFFSHLLDIIHLPQYGAKKYIKKPEFNEHKCNYCKVCAKLCPMGAINKKTLEIDESICICCMSCVKKFNL